MRYFLLILLLMGLGHIGFAQNGDFNHPSLLSFEEGLPPTISTGKNGSLKLSDLHYKHGKKSLMWKWRGERALIFLQDIGFKPFDPSKEDKSIGSFAGWFYNEKPMADSLTFVFGTNQTENCSFRMALNFKGWRGIWVAFERDMKGKPVEGMNFMRIEAPKGAAQGTLFLDHLFLCTDIDSRHHTPDHQVPFVNAKTTMHWLMLEKVSHFRSDMPLQEALTKEDVKMMKVVDDRFFAEVFKKQNVTASKMEELQKKFDFYGIIRSGKNITGLPIWFTRAAELYVPLVGHQVARFYDRSGQEVQEYFDLMFAIACSYKSTVDVAMQGQLKQMFLDLYDHMLDQGIAAGSGLGTIHHYGYSWRNYFTALFIMKDELKATKRLDSAVDGLFWFSGVGETFVKPEQLGMDMDAFNTATMGRLASILIMPDSPLKKQYLSCFSRWIDNGLQIPAGLEDAFKIDGSVYHHANHYPAYGVGGLEGATKMVYFLSNTSFKVSQAGHENLKKALLTMRLYCNLLEWPISMSGRHPNGKGKLVPNHFAYLAKAGSPDGAQTVDGELASAYLRLVAGKKNDADAKYFQQQGIQAEKTPNGHWTLPYGATTIHRRDEWLATVRGHSRYLWAAEHYIGANYYGRYLAHGALQVQGQGNPVNLKASGFVQEGWDWNRIPGTTVVEMPLDQLRANILNVDQFSGYEEMLFSDESYAGSVAMDGRDGLYAFKLHEHDKYNGSLRANKSYFFFGNKIICLGSNIVNEVSGYPTHTVLFQNHFEKGKESLFVDKQLIPFGADSAFMASGSIIMDNKRNGYFIPDGDVKILLNEQTSRDQASEKPTKGNFASAVLSHGKAPKNASYQYCMLVDVEPSELVKFQQQMQSGKEAPYRVLQMDATAHIVFDAESATIGYAFFGTSGNRTQGLIKSNSLPCMAMTRLEGDKLVLSVVNPDLALYAGEADELYENGKRVERSIYSRPWKNNESPITELEITLQGHYTGSHEMLKSIKAENGLTHLVFYCKDGLYSQVELQIAD